VNTNGSTGSTTLARRNAQRSLPRRIHVALRVLWAALRKIRWAFLTFIVVLVGGTLLFWLTGVYENPLLSLIYVLNLVTLQAAPSDLPRPIWLQLASAVVLFSGLFALAGGAASLLRLIGDVKEQQLALASTFRDHIIVCGVGRIGFGVINELRDFGESVVAVNMSEKEVWVEPLQRAGVPVIIGDARRKQTLLDAGVERASALVACTSDDLANLDMSLDARELNPNIKVVMRMFDQKLAQNVSKGFGIQTAFSVSALAAPAFAAAATRARVNYSFKLEDQLLNVSTITFKETSPWIGKTVAQVEDEARCAVIGNWANDGMQMNPRTSQIIQPGDRYYIVGGLDALRVLNNGQ
jgi:Trk K+ transport system NAD-binding subunit